MPDEDGWGRDLAIAAIALGAGLVFGWAALGLPMEPPEPGDRLRSAGMIALSLLVPMVAAGAVARSAPLGSLAVALNPPLRRQARRLEPAARHSVRGDDGGRHPCGARARVRSPLQGLPARTADRTGGGACHCGLGEGASARTPRARHGRTGRCWSAHRLGAVRDVQ